MVNGSRRMLTQKHRKVPTGTYEMISPFRSFLSQWIHAFSHSASKASSSGRSCGICFSMSSPSSLACHHRGIKICVRRVFAITTRSKQSKIQSGRSTHKTKTLQNKASLTPQHGLVTPAGYHNFPFSSQQIAVSCFRLVSDTLIQLWFAKWWSALRTAAENTIMLLFVVVIISCSVLSRRSPHEDIYSGDWIQSGG